MTAGPEPDIDVPADRVPVGVPVDRAPDGAHDAEPDGARSGAPGGGAPSGVNRYRLALTTPGALRFVIPGLLARFPIGMTGISILLFIRSVGYEFGTAGALSATSAVGFAVAAPQLARLADRIGQRRILLACAAVGAVDGALFVLSALRGAPLWTLFPAAAVMGAATPAIGSMVRARWSGLLSGSPIMSTAFALESVVDEVIFIFGPIVATFLATGVDPAAGIVCSLVLVCGGSVLLALGTATEPPRSTGPRPAGSALFLGPVAVIAGVNLCFGAMWGSIDMATVAFTTELHREGLAGLLLAAYGIGSSVAGVAYGAREWNLSTTRILLGATALMALGIAPMLLVNDVVVAVLVLSLAGASSAPAMVAGMLLVQDGVPASRRTEAMAWQATAIWLGVAAGSAVSGRLADTTGSHAAYGCALAFGGVAFAVAAAGRQRVAVKPLPEPA
ncbi:MFS transporter [Kitasatospora sp. NPDC058201]|uniref:MFS transporter n=2 Tax=Kitasatospora TaxID=2063 RepID=UPI0036655FC9